MREFQEFGVVGKRPGEFSLSTDEKREYDKFQVDIATEESKIECARIDGETKGIAKGMAQGIAKGKAEGEVQGREKVAKRMPASGMPMQSVSEMSGFSVEFLQALPKN